MFRAEQSKAEQSRAEQSKDGKNAVCSLLGLWERRFHPFNPFNPPSRANSPLLSSFTDDMISPPPTPLPHGQPPPDAPEAHAAAEQHAADPGDDGEVGVGDDAGEGAWDAAR